MKVLIKFGNVREREDVSRQLRAKGCDVCIEHLAFGSYFIKDDGTITPIHKGVSNIAEGVFLVSVSTVTMVCAASRTERNLNTTEYNCKSKEGYRTGGGKTFEDLFSRAERKKGKVVDARIGKTNKWGGPDVRVDGVDYQCKCSLSAKRTADKIQERNGYPNQYIVTNRELAEPLRRELSKKERDGLVPKGTASRVLESEISYSKVRETNRPCTKESLLFDCETASSTGIVTAIVVFCITLGIGYLNDKTVTRTHVMKATRYGLMAGAIAFILHVVWKQWQRIDK